MTDTFPRIEADDATIRAALEQAHIPSLMNALVHLTADMGLLRGDIRPGQAAFIGDPQSGITPEQQARVRARALDVLRELRDRPAPLPPPPSPQAVGEMLRFVLGQDVPEAYVEFLVSELALYGEDPYAQPALERIPEARRARFRVLVIGAGMSGLLAAIRLKQAGIEFVVIEKNPDVGGTWYENRYPGCRVDSPNHVYSYSFRPNDWPQHFSERAVLASYFASCADEHALRPHIRFETEVVSARFHDATGLWRVETRGKGGHTETLEANAIISATGQLNRPKLPQIDGRDDFAGPAFHSARWEPEHDLTGKRVGVIGTGASAFQLVPIVAERAESVTIFQRTPPWVLPNPDYFADVPAGKHWLLRHVPFYAKWFRFNVFWRAAEGLLGVVRHDPSFTDTRLAVSPQNEMARQMLLANLRANLGSDPELLAKATPDYPFGAKRALIDDGAWLRSLMRDDVHLVTDPIDRITPAGVLMRDGHEHELDVIVYATGFHASGFLEPIRIYGRGGVELHEHWKGEPRAYKGIVIPGFPNFFCCYGPNTNIVVNGSIVFFSECEVRYILGCIATLLERGDRAMDCKLDVHDAYNRHIDAGNREMAWGLSSVNTWYKNESGRITQNWPFTMREFWEQTRAPDTADFTFL